MISGILDYFNVERRDIENNNYLIFKGIVFWRRREKFYVCYVDEFNEEDLLLHFYRKEFQLTESINDKYGQFIDNFCSNPLLRQKYIIDNYGLTPTDGGIDEGIVDAVTSLNNLGYETQFSCQGVNPEEGVIDIQHRMLGHSSSAYISFKEKLPKKMRKALSKVKQLRCDKFSVFSSHPEYNAIFPEIVESAVKRYVCDKR